MTVPSSEQSGMSPDIRGTSVPPPRSQKEGAAPASPKVVTMECGAAIGKGEMESFVRSFQQSARRWEFVVYPALAGFIVLAAYGFFLILSLTKDMSTMALSMDPQMGKHMESMTDSVLKLSDHIQVMTFTMAAISSKLDTLSPMLAHMSKMDQSIARMDQAIGPMNLSISSMSQSIAHLDGAIDQMKTSVKNIDTTVNYLGNSIHVMTLATDQMRKDMMMMNRGINDATRPMAFFNSFTPW